MPVGNTSEGRFDEQLGVWFRVPAKRYATPCPALFVDRDGVIIEDPGYLCRAAEMQLIPGAAEVIAYANRRGIPVIEITNQAGIGRGYYGWQEFLEVEAALADRLAEAGATIDAVFACPYHREGVARWAHPDHPARKPRPGMLLLAARLMNLDLTSSWVVGDKHADLLSGQAAGLRGGLHVLTGKGAAHRAAVTAWQAGKFEVHTGASIRDTFALVPLLAGAESSLSCLLIADDLTGACDAAAPFAGAGLPAVVALADSHLPARCRVLALSTESRDAAPQEIRAAIRRTAALASGRHAGIIFKKIDSTLRGNTGVEIAAALEEFHCRAAVVCPAFPAMHRIVQDGCLKVAGAADFEPIHLSGRISCTHISAGELRSAVERGDRILSLDAVCDEDLDRIAAAILALDGPILWAGSAGLASALARLLRPSGATAPRPQATGPVLFCIGSDHSVTLAQQQALLATGHTVLAPSDETIAAALARGRHVLLRIARGGITAETVHERIAGAAPAAFVLSGGDTASLVCNALGVQAIELCHELMPGVPVGILRGGGFDGTAVVTKSGGFGDSGTLLRVAHVFANR